MSIDHDDTRVPTPIWSPSDAPEVSLDEDCSPTKTCRNVAGMTFDGFAEGGTDLRAAWRERLASEGKLRDGGGSIRDLVLGQGSQS